VKIPKAMSGGTRGKKMEVSQHILSRSVSGNMSLFVEAPVASQERQVFPQKRKKRKKRNKKVSEPLPGVRRGYQNPEKHRVWPREELSPRADSKQHLGHSALFPLG